MRNGVNEITAHHIVPKSRGGVDGSFNLAPVKRSLHEAYHTLFNNSTPDEVIAHLVKEYWNGQWEWVEKALSKRP